MEYNTGNKVEIVTSQGAPTKHYTPMNSQAKSSMVNQGFSSPQKFSDNTYTLHVQPKGQQIRKSPPPMINQSNDGVQIVTRTAFEQHIVERGMQRMQQASDFSGQKNIPMVHNQLGVSSPQKTSLMKRNSYLNSLQNSTDSKQIMDAIKKGSPQHRSPSQFTDLKNPANNLEYGMHGYQQRNGKQLFNNRQSGNGLGGTLDQQLVEVSASILFNAKQDQTSHYNQLPQRKAILPNLNPRHRDQSSNLAQSNNGASQLSAKHIDQFDERKYATLKQNAETKKHEVTINLVRGLQNNLTEMNYAQYQSQNDKKQFDYRKASHPPPPPRDYSMIGSTQQNPLPSGGSVQSYSQLPSIAVKVTSNNLNGGKVMLNKPMNNSSSQVNVLIGPKVDEKLIVPGGHNTMPFQTSASPDKDLNSSDFTQQWFKTPNFKMQGQGIISNSQMKQYSIDTLQKIRAQAVIAPGLIQSVATNQFQPNVQSIQGQITRNPGLPRNSITKASTQPIVQSNYDQHLNLQDSYQEQFNETNDFKSSRGQQPVVPDSSSSAMRVSVGSHLQSDPANSGAYINTRQSISSMKQEKQIKTGNSQQASIVKTAVIMNKNGASAEEMALVNHSQINQTMTQGNDSPTYNSPPKKEKSKGKGDNKKIGSGHTRQLSQAQRQNRNSLVGKQGGRGLTTGKDSGANNRQVVMNSPLMQPPPQILQSKIIINLLRTEYPLIEQVAKQEMNWRVSKTENPNAEFDVYWNDIGIDSERLASLKPYQKTNHFPAMFQITRKTFLAKNLKRLQKLYPLEFDFFPKTWILPNELNDLRTCATQKIKKQKSLKQLAISPTSPKSTNGKISAFGTNKEQSEQTRAGHDSITKNGYTPQGSMPQTSASKADGDDEESSSDEEDDSGDDESPVEVKETVQNSPVATPSANTFGPKRSVIKEPRKAPTICKQRKKSRFPMIVKPDCSSQGKGIFLTNDIDQIPKDDIYVVQQYMQNPYLLDGLKFDLRLYVVVLSCEPLKIFLYQEGLVRFATHLYKPIEPNADKAQLNNLYMHLTNYAVNKENASFKMAKGMNDETAHKRTLKKVLERLKADGLDTEKIMGEIKDVIIKTLITIQQELAHNYRTCQPADLENLMCFEILGFDIILDDKGKPVLLEVNQAPSFATDSPLDWEIKKGLFQDTFKLLGLSVEKKKAKVKRLYEEKKDRMLTKLTLKQKNQQRRQAMNEFRRDQDAFEIANNGRLEKIYPLPVKDAAESNLKAQDDLTLSLAQKQLAQSQYQALQRQQDRYNQLLATLGNSDIEKAIRAKQRQDDAKVKDEKEKNNKLRLKRQDKKRHDNQQQQIRQASQQYKKSTLSPDAVAEESMEQMNMRISNIQPRSNMESQSMDQQFRQSVSDRHNDNKSQVIHQKYSTANVTPIQPMLANHALSQNFALKHPVSQQERALLMRDSMNNGVPIDTNQHLRQLIEIQQKLATSVNNGSKTTSFNLVNFGIQSLQSQAAATLTSRTASTKKHGEFSSAHQQMIEGLKPNITQLTHQNIISSSQNPINPSKLNSGEFDMKMNRTTGQSNRQANLLPNIARNMIQVEKSSSGFTNQQAAQMNLLQQQAQYSRGSSNQRQQRFRDNQQLHSATSNTAVKQMTPGEVALIAAQQMNSGLASPKRPAAQVQFQRCAIVQQHPGTGGPKPNSIKTQQMNLGASVQPVIIDSNHFDRQGQPISPTKGISAGGYKNQKFSKIQLQAIIDNLYQYESKAGVKVHQGSATPQQQSMKIGHGSISEAPKDLSKTANFTTVGGVQQMMLPVVNSNDNIHMQSSTLANRAVNVIAQQNASAAIQANIMQSHSENRGSIAQSPADGQTPVRLASQGSPTATSPSGPKLAHPSSVENLLEQTEKEQARFTSHREQLQKLQTANLAPHKQISSAGKRTVMSPKKSSSGGGNFQINGSSFQSQEPRQPSSGQNVGSPKTTNVLTFNNCNVTIINNAGNNFFEGAQGGPGQSTIIQSSLMTRPLNATKAGNAASPGPQHQAPKVDEQRSPGGDEN